jgi:Zn-dependent peptidase ImmA (M78 family)
VAHEIGETLAHRVFEDLAVDPREVSPSAREQIANQLAARLLLPKTWFAVDAAACGWDLAALKLRYATASHELIARRMLDFPDAVVITIFDQGVPRFRRASWGRQASPLRPLELDCRRVVHTTGRPDRRSDEVSTVRGWPVHEPEWKREILRLEWNDAED